MRYRTDGARAGGYNQIQDATKEPPSGHGSPSHGSVHAETGISEGFMMIELANVDSPRSRAQPSAVLSRLTEELLRSAGCGCAEHAWTNPQAVHVCPPHTAAAPSLEIEIVDWDALFRAVEERLKRTVVERPERSGGPYDPVGRIQHIVLDCVEALDLLHAALTAERARALYLECEVMRVRGNVPL